MKKKELSKLLREVSDIISWRGDEESTHCGYISFEDWDVFVFEKYKELENERQTKDCKDTVID